MRKKNIMLLIAIVFIAHIALRTNQVFAGSWEKIHLLDPAIEHEVSQKVGHKGPYTQDELDSITSIYAGYYIDYDSKSAVYAKSLSDLVYLRNLDTLSVSSDKITSLYPIRKLPIKDLSISSAGIDDLSPLSNLNLDKIDIHYTKITSLHGLNLSSTATSVNIYNNSKLSDVSVLSQYPNLEDLNLSYNSITDISFLNDINSVSKLNLRSNKITDIKPISKFSKIDSLDLSSNPLDTDEKLNPLNSIDTITNLELDGIGADENLLFTFLYDNHYYGGLKQPKITSLSVNNNSLPMATNLIKQIGKNTSIKSLSLANCTLKTFEDFHPITGRLFDRINLSDNSLNNIQSTQSLAELEKMNISNLYLSNNNLSNDTLIKPVSKISNLKTITLTNNKFSKFEVLQELSDLPNLSYIDLSYNKFTNTDDIHLIDNNGELNIDLRYNEIDNANILGDNNAIQALNLSDNKIKTIKNVDRLKKLTSFISNNNQTKDFTAFKELTTKVTATSQVLPKEKVTGSYFEYPIFDNKGDLVKLKSNYFKNFNNGYKFTSLPGSSLTLDASKYNISWSIPLDTSGVKLTTGAEDFVFSTTGVKTKEDFISEEQLKNSVKNLPNDAYITIINNPTRTEYTPDIKEIETKRTRIIDTTTALKNKDNTKIKSVTSQNKVDFNTSGKQTDKLDITRVSEKSESTIKITFGDGSSKEYKIPVTYEENTKTYDAIVNILPLESDLFIAETHKITSTITKPVDIKTGLDSKLPEGATVEIYEDVDVNTLGDKVGKIKIIFSDNSEKIVNINVEIIDWLKNTFKPNIEPEKVIVGDKIDITNNIPNIPTGSEVTDITNPAVDKDKLQETTGTVHVKFPDGSEINYEIPIVIYNACDNTSALKEKIQDLLKEIERLNKSIKENEKTIEELKEKNLTNKDEYKTIIQQLNDKLKEANDKITELQKEIQQLKEEIEKLKLANKILDSENKELKAQVILLEKLLKESQTNNIKRAEEIVRLKTQIEILEKDNKEKGDKITTLEGQIEEKDKIIERETKTIEDKTNEIERLKALIEEKETRIKDLEKQTEQDKDLINKLKAEIERLKAEIERLTKELNESKDLVKKLTEELNLLKEKYKKLQDKYSNSISQLEEKDNIIKDLTIYKNLYDFQSSGGTPDYTKNDSSNKVEENSNINHSSINKIINPLSNLGLRNQVYTIFYINQKYYDTISDTSKNRNYMDTDVFIVNDRTMLPLRYLAYSLDINVEYDNNTRSAIFTNTKNPVLKQETIKVNIDTGIMTDSKGNKYTPDSKPVIKNNRIHASIANVSQLFGATHGKTLVWDGQKQEVRVYKNIK